MKPHVQLRKLNECPDGTRFFTYTTCRPYTLVTRNKAGEVYVHRGHDYDRTSMKTWWAKSARGWVVV